MEENICDEKFNPYQPSIAFHIETSHLICRTNQMTGFYMKCKTGLKWVNINPISATVLINFNVFQCLKRISLELMFTTKI